MNIGPDRSPLDTVNAFRNASQGQVVLVMQGGGALGAYQGGVYEALHEAGSGAPPVLVAFGDYDAMRLRQFASVHGGALVEGWQLFAAASLFSEAAE
jgi:hypothetical protein